MCTAITQLTHDFYFGRTLDLDDPDDGQIVITPRSLPLFFRYVRPLFRHHAIIGMAQVMSGYPLYYDAMNDRGLCMAGLDFTGWAHYGCGNGPDQVCHFELIPWLLGQCATVEEARELLEKIHLTEDGFRQDLKPAELHWLIADRTHALTVEATGEGIRVYSNPAGVLTNNPPFDQMMFSLNRYLNLTSQEPENRFSPVLDLKPTSHGMGAMGLPGDLSSQSRFVRAAFTKLNSVCGETEEESVAQFFHMMGAVSQTRGVSVTEEGKYERTVYTSCCNADRGIYYYTTYENPQITAIDLRHVDLDGRELICYPRINRLEFHRQN